MSTCCSPLAHIPIGNMIQNNMIFKQLCLKFKILSDVSSSQHNCFYYLTPHNPMLFCTTLTCFYSNIFPFLVTETYRQSSSGILPLGLLICKCSSTPSFLKTYKFAMALLFTEHTYQIHLNVLQVAF